MVQRILVIGGYGNFGRFISKMLAREPNIQLIIAGRNKDKASLFAKELASVHKTESIALDIYRNLEQSLATIKPDIVIHTSGPYQDQEYNVARACIAQGCHYIDLADARDFVANISTLNHEARSKGVIVCSGASSVPCLTGAIVDHYNTEFKRLDSLEYGIATAHLTNRGLATTSAVFSYAGQPFKTLIDGEMQTVYGWMNLRMRDFWKLNRRFLGNCDIPDLSLFPERYPDLRTIRFQAGLELKFLHLIFWMMSCLVRWKILPSLRFLASLSLKISRLFDPLGHDDSGFYMLIKGLSKSGDAKSVTFDIVARHADGAYIPSMPAILMAKKLARGDIRSFGAFPCLGFITLDEYLEALGEFDIEWQFSDKKAL